MPKLDRDGQASADLGVLADKIEFEEMSTGMIAAGIDAYAEWEARPERSRTTANLVSAVAAAVEAARRLGR